MAVPSEREPGDPWKALVQFDLILTKLVKFQVWWSWLIKLKVLFGMVKNDENSEVLVHQLYSRAITQFQIFIYSNHQHISIIWKPHPKRACASRCAALWPHALFVFVSSPQFTYGHQERKPADLGLLHRWNKTNKHINGRSVSFFVVVVIVVGCCYSQLQLHSAASDQSAWLSAAFAPQKRVKMGSRPAGFFPSRFGSVASCDSLCTFSGHVISEKSASRSHRWRRQPKCALCDAQAAGNRFSSSCCTLHLPHRA